MLEPQRFRLTRLAFVIGAAMTSGHLLAAEDEGPTQAGANPLDSVIVTGTRRVGTTSLEAPAPVDVLSSEQLTNTGAADLSRALASLSPSFSAPTTPNGGFASSIPAGAALRGLQSDQVLVLINGKRRHVGANFTRQALSGGRGAAAVDLSLIPVASIARVEILRDGAAAQYGSDAIAGVINIVLKGVDSGGGIGYRYGEYSHSAYGGEQHTISGWKGISLGNDGFLTLSFDAGIKELANNTAPDPSLSANHPFKNWAFGSPQVRDQFNLVANAELPINAEVSLYAFATYGQRETTGENFYESNNAASVFARSIYFQQRYPFGRIPVNVYDNDDGALNIGVRFGNERIGRFDLSANYGYNSVKSRDENAINPSYGPNSPSSFSSGEREHAQTNIALDWSRELELALFTSPATVSAGVAYRDESYRLTAGDPIAYTRGPFYNPSQVFGVGIPGISTGITPEDERKVSRDVIGGYVGLEGNVTKRLNLGLALRYEDYSDFGETTNGKASLRFDVTPEFAIRSTISNGYRAPSIVQLGYSAYSVQTATIAGVPTDVQQRFLLSDSDIARQLGGKPLEPEKSKNVSLGFVWRPAPKTSATLDIYQIDIDKRISLSENLSATNVPSIAPILLANGISSAAFFTNILDTRTRGLELTGKTQIDLRARGTLDLSVGYAYNETEITKARDVVTPGGAVVPARNIIPRATAGLYEDGTPNHKWVFGSVWKTGPWELTGAGRYYGKFTSRNSTSALDDLTYGAQWIFDGEAAYAFTGALRGVKVALGAINLFDSYPERNRRTVRSTGLPPVGSGAITKYSFNSPEGGLGRFIYARVNYAF